MSAGQLPAQETSNARGEVVTRAMVEAGWATGTLLGDTRVIQDLTAAYLAMRSAAPPPAAACPNCDDTGDVTRADGEWRGVCTCPAGQPPAAARGDVRGLDLPLIACMLGDLGSNDASTYPAEVVAAQIRAIEALAAEGVQAGEVGDVPMTPDRAAFFLRRFKADEKMLGPHEQQALDFAIAALSQQPEARGVVRHDLCDCPNGRAEHSPSCAALTGERNG